jgi:signal transduction histidine kinase
MALSAPKSSTTGVGRPGEPISGRAAEPFLRAVEPRDANDVVRDLVEAQELERRRMARDLHDVVGQALTAVRLSLEAIRNDPRSGAAEKEARRSIEVVDAAMREVRDLAFGLRPAIIDDLGLAAAAHWYVSREARAVGYRARFRATDIDVEIPAEIESACFAILREAITNVARHAKATLVEVDLRIADRELRLVVADNGCGFGEPPERRRRKRPTLGLIGAAERVSLVGGSLDIRSEPDQGTRMEARFPIARHLTAIEGRP